MNNDPYRHWSHESRKPGVGETALWIVAGSLVLLGAAAWAYYASI